MRTRLFPLVLLAALVVWAGCDSSDTDMDPPEEPAVAASAATAVASSVGIAPGGVLFDLAEAVRALDALQQSDRFALAGCSGERVWDEETATWTQDFACEHGFTSGPFYARTLRTQTFALLDAEGAPVQDPADAAAVTMELYGEGVRRTPYSSHALSESAAQFTLSGLDASEITVNGTSSRTATDSLQTREGLRTFTYTTTLSVEDVTGPRRPSSSGASWWSPPSEWDLSETHRAWAGDVSGTIAGRLVGELAWETPEGVRTREVDQAFSVAFDGEGAASVQIGGTTFTVDLVTGEVR